MWRSVLALVFVGFVAGAVLWVRSSGVRGSPNLAPEEANSVENEVTRAELAPVASELVSRAPVETVGATEAQVASPSPKSPASAPNGGKLALTGTIVVVDELGQTHAAEDGSFSLTEWRGDMGEGHEVEVHAGRWSTVISTDPPLAGLSIDYIRLGERGAVPSGDVDERFPVPESRWLELVARWPQKSLLHVRDRVSSRELAPVLLVEVEEWPERELGHPGERAARARDLGPSPVEVEDGEFPGQRSLFVRSPGYAWARIEIDETRGGERFVLLDPACELEIELVGEARDPGTRLRLFGSAYSPVFEDGLNGVTAQTIEALPPGSYRVVAQVGNYWRDPLVLGETTVEVAVGGPAHATLVLAEPAERVDVPFAGTLVLPSEWALERFQLDFELLDTPLGGWDGRRTLESESMTRDAPDRYRWSAGIVQPGRYEAKLDELGFSVLLEVPATGSTDARVEVSPPCEIFVRCVDEDTGLDVTTESVSWHCAVPAGVRAWSLEEALWDDGPRRWRIRAPIGSVLLETAGQNYTDIGEEVEAKAGRNDVCLRLARLTGLELVLRDGATELPWSDDMEATLQPLEGQAAYPSSRWGDGTFTFLGRAPGNYELRVAPIAGYEPIPPAVVRLEKGVVGRHELKLVRLH